MTLSTRLALSIAILVAGIGVMGVAALVTLQDLHARLAATDELYSELRGVYEIGHRAAAARLLLNAPTHDAAEIRRQLLAALQETNRLLSSATANAALTKSLESIRTNIENALVTEGDAHAVAQHAQMLHASLGEVASLAAAANREILSNRQQTTATVQNARLTVGVLLAGVSIVAVALGWLQYRAIAKPLRALRKGVEQMAQRKLEEPIPERGPRELRELIRQFNHMAEMIRTLEQSLTQQVETKSKQLIRSERLAGLGYLAAGLAHEINNPLGVIGGYAETMLRRLEGNTGQTDVVLHDLTEALRTIAEEVFRCHDITAGLLQMTRHAEDQAETIDLHGLIERVVLMVRRLPLCKDRQLVLDEPAGAPLLVRGSRSQLTQVLLNLLTNALEAVESGAGVVTISAASQSGSALIRVSDNGCGMNSETLEHVFDPLFTDKPRRGLTGFGMGLSVSHAIIERHGGRIDASSPGPGQGSVFVVELPAIVAMNVVETADERR